jgi:hypothetical protein
MNYNHDPSLYIYREKKVFYNIEGQLRGLPGSGHPKTCAPLNNLVATQVQALKACTGAFCIFKRAKRA